MTQTTYPYLMKTQDGKNIPLSSADLVKLEDEMNDPSLISLRIGDKAYAKALIVWVAKREAIEQENKNVTIRVGPHFAFANAEDVQTSINNLNDAVNGRQYILFEDVFLFNRAYYQFAAPYTPKDASN